MQQTPLLALNIGPWQTLFSVIETIFIILDVALLIAFFIALFKGIKYRPDLHLRAGKGKEKSVVTIKKVFFEEQWKTINKKFESGSPDSSHVAIIEADALVDKLLKQIGLKGDHLADRLDKLDPEDVQTLERVWRAHRVRNDLVHIPGYMIRAEDAKKVLDDYHAFFKEVGVID